MATNTNQPNKEMRELREELSHLTTLVQKNLKNAASNNASNVLGFSSSDIRDFAQRAGETVRHYVDDTSKHAGEMRDKAKDSITTHPFRAVATAVAGGLILGALLRRK